ncbi:hypothetical protein B0O80DRAFT_289164 [Mortierella sp. GBAus27b]|nr:hypothetical protein BGX31_003566 [Mortierella sp. GBA43]KAI8357479.1 hypothetical protein B0O80DRAFT_289164 [Mortierella sp. GBAus27b]
MFRTDNFITFNDLTPEARFLWVSPSTHDILGYDPEELLGTCGYNIVYPDDYAETKDFQREYIMSDLVASQIIVRINTKDGRVLLGLGFASVCYDFAVACVTILDSNAEAHVQRRAHYSAANRRMGARKEEFERLRRHHEAFSENSWDHQAMEPEPRVCLILNRFARGFTIMYASSACDKVLNVDPDEITGKPVLLYIRSDDLALFVEQMDLVKTMVTVSHMRFWFQSPNCRQEIPCEAVIFGAADGIVAVVRNCKPFVRKHLIVSREHFEDTSRGSSVSSRWTRSYGSSPASELSVPPTFAHRSGYESKSSSPPRNVSKETLNQIRILDLNDDPCTPEPTNHSKNEMDIPVGGVSRAPGFIEVMTQDYVDDDDAEVEDIDV